MSTDHQSNNDYDVIIVGAGLSGLIAATELKASGKKVMVLEAGQEVGGRTVSRMVDNNVVDLGAEFIGSQHKHLLALTKTLGLKLEAAKISVKSALWGQVGTHATVKIPKLAVTELISFLKISLKLTFWAMSINKNKPWDSRFAAQLDSLSFQQWLTKNKVKGKAYSLLEKLVSGYSTGKIDNISLLQVAWWLRMPGGVMAALRDGGLLRISEGAQRICVRLAIILGVKNIKYNTKVVSIAQNEKKAVVITEDYKVHTARNVVVTVPLTVVNDIDFAPPLDNVMRSALDNIHFGRTKKISLAFNRDVSPDYDLAVGVGNLAFAWHKHKTVSAITFEEVSNADSDEVNHIETEIIKDEICDLYGQKFSDITGSAAIDWGLYPNVHGTHVIFAPGQLIRYSEVLRKPHGFVYFAGAERSNWPDSMEGAIESGYHVAHKLISTNAE